MLIKRIISTFLVALMLLSSVSLVISATSQEQPTQEASVYEYNTSKNSPTMDYFKGEYTDPETNDTIIVSTKEQKLQTMDMRLEQNGFRLYVDEYSGEVALENIKTGDVLFTNPYDVGVNKGLDNVEKTKFLSQIFITYKDMTNRMAPDKTYSSYEHAASNGEGRSQIVVKYIKNGIRVEYSIGRVDRYLVPIVLSEEDFNTKIIEAAKANGLSEWDEMQLKNFYSKVDLESYLSRVKEEDKEDKKRTFLEKYGVSKSSAEAGPFYYLTDTNKLMLAYIDSLIRTHCPDYTFEKMDESHLAFDYKPADSGEALFKIALEYTVDEKGLSVRVPANGIRFDDSIYCIKNIEILPFMGAGTNPNSGYTFFPDGAGTLFDFENLAAIGGETYFFGACYGDDFAYYNIGSGSPHQEVVRYPVFGLKEDITDSEGNERSRGFVAIVEEGDAMMTFYSYHSPEYNSVRMRMNPRPYDEYKASDAISVAGDEKWTVVSPRKYTGNFTVRYIMLTDESVASGEGYYEPSYVGMAKTYRDYLVDKGVLTRLTKDDIKEDIPLYIETFGAIETTEKFLSIPYKSMKPLTSFKDITKMYDELSDNGIENINFILTGYSKGGMNVDQIPYSLKWDKAVKKEMKFEELIDYARQNEFGVYPDFDFVFASDNKLFDGMSLMNHAIKAIDGRYTSKREYSATRQSYVSYFELAMSPAYFSHFYEKLSKNYTKYDPLGISVSTLGTYLNSDFDEDEPYHREDSKEFTEEAFKYFNNNYSKVLTSGGNAYTWKYVDYITDVATDSSRYARSSATVPFLGIVLHGYVQFAGEAINMEGNIDYAMLRTIENGASLKFILSYQNTELLKEYESTSKYYSVRYDIWVEDLIARYNEINSVLSDVQLSTIEHHEFLDGIRIPNEDEIDADSSEQLLDAVNKEIQESADAKESLRLTLQNIRKNLYDCGENMAIIGDTEDETNEKAIKFIYAAASDKLPELNRAKNDADSKKLALDSVKAVYDAEPSKNNQKNYKDAAAAYDEAIVALKAAYTAYMDAVNAAIEVGTNYVEMFEHANDNFAMLNQYNAYPDGIIEELDAIRQSLVPTYTALKAMVSGMVNEVQTHVSDIEAKYAKELGIIEETKQEVDEFDKYSIAKNSIVYEVFENGKAVILNFNNYSVKVKLGDTYYTVGAYGYIIMN